MAAKKLHAFLLQDVVEDILSRLAVKSLIRFKCVSKAWLLLITSRQFVKFQLERASSQNPKVLALIQEDIYNVSSQAVLLVSQNHVGYEVEPLDVGFPLGSTRTTKSGKVFTSFVSCNGLVCVEFYNKETEKSDYIFWNPSTRSYRNIPRSSTFDSSCNWNLYTGFGYDYSTDDYKLLWSHDDIRSTIIEFEIFSLKTFTWRKINQDKTDSEVTDAMNDEMKEASASTYFNGAIYWIRKPKPMSLDEERFLPEASIIYFDLAEEIFHEMYLPDPVISLTIDESFEESFQYSLDLVILGEHLGLSVWTDEDLSIQLWMMKESWTRLATIPNCNTCLKPIFFSNNNFELLMRDTGFEIEREIEKLIMYNLKENTKTTLFKPKAGIEKDFLFRHEATYVESLYSLDCNDGRQVLRFIPQDLVEKILSRLTVKHLLRFKCVSKTWYSLITSRQFAKSHFQIASQNPKVFALIDYDNDGVRVVQSDIGHDGGFEFEPVDFGFPLRGTSTTKIDTLQRRLAYCNGLVCVELKNVKKCSCEYLVWSPSTRSYRNIPRSRISIINGTYSFGFGYDSSTDDYKLLRSYYSMRTRKPKLAFQIFSLKTFTWREIYFEDKDKDGSIYDRLVWSDEIRKQCSMYFNGAIYWIVVTDYDKNDKGRKPSLIYFDLAEERFHQVACPESVTYFSVEGYYSVLVELGILKEHLCLSVCTGQDSYNLSVQLWVMKESWTWRKVITIPGSNTCLKPIFLSNNLPYFLMLDVGYRCDGVKLKMYNYKEKTYRTIFEPKPRIKDRKTNPLPVIEVAIHVESLYSFDCNDGPAVGDQVLARKNSNVNQKKRKFM